MKQTVTEYDFRRAFEAQRPNNFSVGGLGALYRYIEDLEEETGEEVELDVIAICCDYCEYTAAELAGDYGYMVSGCQPSTIEEWEGYLADHTTVIPVGDDSLIIAAF